VISVPILEEYRRVLAEMVGEHFSPVPHSILGLIELHSEMVEPRVVKILERLEMAWLRI